MVSKDGLPEGVETDADQPLHHRLADAPRVESAFPELAELNRHDRDLALADFRYLLERRDKLTERIRFGLLTLNGASLLALLSALGGSGQAATWLGFTRENAIYSATAFTAGLFLAGSAVWAQQNWYTEEVGDASKRVRTLARTSAQFRRPLTKRNVDQVGKHIDEVGDLPLVGFQYSFWAILAQNAAASAWFIGIATPLLDALGLSR